MNRSEIIFTLNGLFIALTILGSYSKCTLQSFQADSGGPLTYKQKWRKGKSQHVLIGVVSQGVMCNSVTITKRTILFKHSKVFHVSRAPLYRPRLESILNLGEIEYPI